MEDEHISARTKFSLGIFLATTLTMMGTGCSLWNQPPVNNGDPITTTPLINDTTLAQALLTEDDITTVDGMEDARPAVVELNDHLDTTIPADYNFYVAQMWYDRPTSTTLLQTAITQLADPQTAQAAIVAQAKDFTPVAEAKSVGDTTVVYYQAANDEDQAVLTYRFTVDQYSTKVQVYATTDDALSDTELQTAMTPIAYDLAARQANKLKAFLNGQYTPPQPTPVMQHLPTILPATTYVGQVAMTDQEWLGVSFDMERDHLTGYTSGGVGRFKMMNNKDEVVEVAMMEFDTAEHAQTFQAELKAGIDGQTTTKIEVPADLGVDQVDAIHRPGLVELQALQDNYVIDISIFAPFSPTDEPSKDDLLTMSREVLKNFKPE